MSLIQASYEGTHLIDMTLPYPSQKELGASLEAVVGEVWKLPTLKVTTCNCKSRVLILYRSSMEATHLYTIHLNMASIDWTLLSHGKNSGEGIL